MNNSKSIQLKITWELLSLSSFSQLADLYQINFELLINQLSTAIRYTLCNLQVDREKLRVKIKITIVVYVCKTIIRLNFNKCIRWSVVSHKRHFRLERMSVQMEKSYHLLQSLRCFQNRRVTQVYSFEFMINILHGAGVYRVPRVRRIGVIVSDSTNDVEPER